MPLDLDLARERFESSTDFTIGLEEEFAILDPQTLALGAMGTHPWANYLEQRIIDTPH